MYVCYLDGSTKNNDLVVVSGIFCHVDDVYQRVDSIIYCFKNIFELKFGLSIHEEMALINAMIEMRKIVKNNGLREVTYINDSMSLNKKINVENKSILKAVKENIEHSVLRLNKKEINTSDIANYKNINDTILSLYDILDEIHKNFEEIELKENFLYVSRDNVGISIANQLNKEIDCYVGEKNKIYLSAALKKLTQRSYLYNNKVKK